MGLSAAFRTPRTDVTAQSHADKVDRVARQLREHPRDRPVSLRKRAVSHQVPKRGDKRLRDDKIDLTDLDGILDIDVDARTCTAEPGVTFAALVEATLRHGLLPMTVPEFKAITIGGAVSGCSIESMSYKYGGFHDSCLEYEVITTAGEVLVCTPDNEHQLVFQMMHGSFGTLGVLSRLKFRLVPARPFVHVTYRGVTTVAEYVRLIRELSVSPDVDFIDGFAHGPGKYVLNVGRFVDSAPYTSRYDWYKVYYQSTAARSEDYLTTADYLFRYDRGVTNPIPKSLLGRLLLGKVSGSTNVLWLAEKLNRFLPAESPGVTLDMFLPLSRMEDYLRWHTAQIGHYPLWVVPYKRVRDYEWIAPEFYANTDDDLFVDLAIYGMKQPPGRNLYKELEDALPAFNAIKTLISFNYYDEATFWRVFHEPNHRAAKKVTDPRDLLRDLYQKTCVAAQGR